MPEFDFHENERVVPTHFRMNCFRTKTRFDKGAKGKS